MGTMFTTLERGAERSGAHLVGAYIDGLVQDSACRRRLLPPVPDLFGQREPAYRLSQ